MIGWYRHFVSTPLHAFVIFWWTNSCDCIQASRKCVLITDHSMYTNASFALNKTGQSPFCAAFIMLEPWSVANCPHSHVHVLDKAHMKNGWEWVMLDFIGKPYGICNKLQYRITLFLSCNWIPNSIQCLWFRARSCKYLTCCILT